MSVFEAFLARRGEIEPLAVVEVLETVREQRPRIGQLALAEQLLSVAEVCEVLDRQLESQLPFGAIAVDLGYLSEKELGGLLQLQQQKGPRGAEVLRSRGLLDERRLLQLHALYTSDLGLQYAGDPADVAVTELLATQGLSLLLAQVRSVQPFAPAVARALSVLAEPTFHPQQVARELTADPGLSARLQGMARMPWFAEGVVGRSAAALVGSLGRDRTRELLLASTFVDLYQQSASQSPLMAHSVGVAAIAHTLARWSGAVEPTSLGVAGLWHDVGRLLFCRSPELDRAVLGSDEQEFPTSSHLIERMRFGFDHAVLGELGLRLWGFPDDLAFAVGLHHYHRPPAGISAASQATLGLLAAADLFDHGFAARDSSQLARVEGLWTRFELANVLPLNQVRVRWRQLREARAEALVAFEALTSAEPRASYRLV